MYCTVDDITRAFDEKTIANLSNDTDPTTVDIEVVAKVIKSVSAMIDGYLRGRYPLPLRKEHDIIHNLTIELTRIELYKRRDKLTDRLAEQYKNLTATLVNIQKGIVMLDEPIEANHSPLIAVATSKGVFDSILTQFRRL